MKTLSIQALALVLALAAAGCATHKPQDIRARPATDFVRDFVTA